MNCPNGAKPYRDSPLPGPEALPLADRWILSRLKRTVSSVNRQMESYRFDEASKDLYQFLWHEYCDWYLEWIKPVLYGQDAGMADRARTVAIHVFETVLRLLHPFMPFITEEIRQAMTDREDSIVVAPYPKDVPARIDEAAEQECESVQRVIEGIRGMRSVHHFSSSMKWDATVQVPDQEIERHLENNTRTITTLSKLGHLTIGRQIPRPLNTFSGTVVFSGGRVGEIFIPLTKNAVDVAKETAQKEKLLKELAAQMEQAEQRSRNYRTPISSPKRLPRYLKKQKRVTKSFASSVRSCPRRSGNCAR
jgi:valyl-tRNA synthetase